LSFNRDRTSRLINAGMMDSTKIQGPMQVQRGVEQQVSKASK
jgi:hypothetical protein